MAKATSKRSRQTKGPQRAKPVMSREARAVQVEIRKCVRQLDASVNEIQRGLRKAERQIEASAAARMRALRQDANAPLRALKVKQREAAATLTRVSSAASGTWDDIRRTVDTFVAEARATATAAVGRFRNALGG